MAKTKKAPLTPEEQRKKREKNKIAVMKSREKRKQNAKLQEEKLAKLEAEYIRLTEERRILREQLEKLQEHFSFS